jgi:hypothetical protein
VTDLTQRVALHRGAVRLRILHHAAEREIDSAYMIEVLARHGRSRRMYRATKAGGQEPDEDRRVLAALASEVLGSS